MKALPWMSPGSSLERDSCSFGFILILSELSQLQSSGAYLPRCTWVLRKGWQPSGLESWGSLLTELCDVLSLEMDTVIVTWSVRHQVRGRGGLWAVDSTSSMWIYKERSTLSPWRRIFRVRDCLLVQFADRAHWLNRVIFPPVFKQTSTHHCTSGWGVVSPPSLHLL